jgi:hypothetical protein
MPKTSRIHPWQYGGSEAGGDGPRCNTEHESRMLGMGLATRISKVIVRLVSLRAGQGRVEGQLVLNRVHAPPTSSPHDE